MPKVLHIFRGASDASPFRDKEDQIRRVQAHLDDLKAWQGTNRERPNHKDLIRQLEAQLRDLRRGAMDGERWVEVSPAAYAGARIGSKYEDGIITAKKVDRSGDAEKSLLRITT